MLLAPIWSWQIYLIATPIPRFLRGFKFGVEIIFDSKNTGFKFGHLISRKTALHKSEFVIYSERYISTANGNLSRIKFLYRTMKSVLC